MAPATFVTWESRRRLKQVVSRGGGGGIRPCQCHRPLFSLSLLSASYLLLVLQTAEIGSFLSVS